MIILDTVAHETIWGGQRLVPFADGEHPNIGHLYSLCCEKGLENRILNGRFKGKVFQEYFLSVREKFGLSQYKEFPLILALVEPKMDLSIQVHPDDELARVEESAEYGKNESWYFLEAPTQGSIYNGCLAKSKDEFKQKMIDDDVMSVVDTLPVNKGDYVYVEAGRFMHFPQEVFFMRLKRTVHGLIGYMIITGPTQKEISENSMLRRLLTH